MNMSSDWTCSLFVLADNEYQQSAVSVLNIFDNIFSYEHDCVSTAIHFYSPSVFLCLPLSSICSANKRHCLPLSSICSANHTQCLPLSSICSANKKALSFLFLPSVLLTIHSVSLFLPSVLLTKGTVFLFLPSVLLTKGTVFLFLPSVLLNKRHCLPLSSICCANQRHCLPLFFHLFC